MADLCRLIWCALVGLFRSRASREAEILALRHQLNVLRRIAYEADFRPQIEIVGEIAKMVELGIGPNAKKAHLDEKLTRSVKVVAGVGFVQERTRWELRTVV
jgi:hypothetical protein